MLRHCAVYEPPVKAVRLCCGGKGCQFTNQPSDTWKVSQQVSDNVWEQLLHPYPPQQGDRLSLFARIFALKVPCPGQTLSPKQTEQTMTLTPNFAQESACGHSQLKHTSKRILDCVLHLDSIDSLPDGTVVKNLPATAGDAGDMGSIPESGRSPGVRNGNPLQYSSLENPMDRGA